MIERDMANLAKQHRFAAVGALTDTAFEMRGAVQSAMRSGFDRPTPFVLSGVKVFGAYEPSPGRLEAEVYIDTEGTQASPEDVLRPEVHGGARNLKGAERRLQAVGLMLPGSFMVPSKELLAQGQLVDAYGNVRGSFIRTLLSYLQAFNTAGFTANATRKTRDRIAAKGKSAGGFATINGVAYFVSKGRGERNGRQQHLPAGIWAKRGIHGSKIYPVFLFVSSPRYTERLRFFDICRNVSERTFPVKFKARLARALATAK
ncbi:MAG TPA: hypothetical protein VNU71_22700 [Burkholderiaceae bacterium]|nr:hypothetical protein [Burkholderiaceae bacterium]